ncbi:MAG: S1C family serine protease [Lysobacterales bacterium]
MGPTGKFFLFIGKAIVAGLAMAAVAMIVHQQWSDRPTVTSPEVLPTAIEQRSFAAAVATAAPAVVNIYVDRLTVRQQAIIPTDPQFRRFAGRTLLSPPRLINRRVLGSGVILRQDGIIVTNFHVIYEADNINVALWDGRIIQARVIGVDEESDLAVLKVDYTDLPTLPSPLTPLRVGDVVLAIGNPLGLGKTVTMGIVSATGRSDVKVSLYETLIQTDAAINQGNSGGALVNADGHIVGLNAAVATSNTGNGNKGQKAEGISFAIPIDTVRAVANTLIEEGSVTRGWIGTVLADADITLARRAGGERGVVVAGLHPNQPAQVAGLQVGDYITRLGNVKINDRVGAYRLIADTAPGGQMAVEYWRGGEKFVANVAVVLRQRVANQFEN